VIISTGASAKYLGLPSEEKFANKGVSACAVCDGYFFKGMEVAVVGGGDSAAEESTYLSKLCPKVYLIVRRDELRASKIMQDRVLNTPNIEVLWNTETEEISGRESVESIRVVNNKTGEKKEIPVQGFFLAIGHTPNTEIFRDYIELDATGYIKVKPGTTKTNVEGVFATGDAADKVYRQAVTAAGTGCMGALEAEKFLAAKEMEVA
jgi:thioredoxin reductase (NADPH)